MIQRHTIFPEFLNSVKLYNTYIILLYIKNVFLYKHINYMRTHRIFMNASSL